MKAILLIRIELFDILWFKCRWDQRESVFRFFRLPVSDHFSLNTVRVLVVSLAHMGVFSIDHPFTTFLLVLLLRTFLPDLLKILNQNLHLILSCFLVRLDVINHQIDTLLGLLIFVSFSLFHVFLNGLRCFDSEIVFNDIHIFIDLSYLFVGIYQS